MKNLPDVDIFSEISRRAGVVVVQKKSQIIQLLLSILFGPLGLFYSSLAGGVLFTLVAAGLSVGFFGVGWFLVYPFVLLTGFFTVSRRNREFREGERRHQDVVDAMRQER